ncbi:MAG: SusE domain-containing protein [Candidatus Dadabacteria bacterium]
MKNTFIKIFLPSMLLLLLSSCDKKQNLDYFMGGTNPVLTANKTSIPLSFATKDQEAITLSWTNPNYAFTTGVSSHDVNYLLEIDTTGSNFTNPNRKVISISKDLSYTLTQNDLNDYLLNTVLLKPGMSHNVEMRIVASLDNNSAVLKSNTLKFAITPYAIPPKVDPPSTGHLYLVGNATPGGWNNPVPVPSQEFTKVSPTFYTITINLTGGNSYLFLPLNGDWGHKYGAMGGNNSNNVNGDDFKPEGGDLKAPDVSGSYRIDVDFQRGKFIVTKL